MIFIRVPVKFCISGSVLTASNFSFIHNDRKKQNLTATKHLLDGGDYRQPLSGQWTQHYRGSEGVTGRRCGSVQVSKELYQLSSEGYW